MLLLALANSRTCCTKRLYTYQSCSPATLRSTSLILLFKSTAETFAGRFSQELSYLVLILLQMTVKLALGQTRSKTYLSLHFPYCYHALQLSLSLNDQFTLLNNFFQPKKPCAYLTSSVSNVFNPIALSSKGDNSKPPGDRGENLRQDSATNLFDGFRRSRNGPDVSWKTLGHL